MQQVLAVQWSACKPSALTEVQQYSALNIAMRGKHATEYSVICTHDRHMSEDSLVEDEKTMCKLYSFVQGVVRSPFVLCVCIVCITSDSPCGSQALE